MGWFNKNGKQKVWLREVLAFVFLFILMSLNSWNRLTSWNDLGRALLFFLTLYGQAQFHRFVLFPLLFKQQIRQYILWTVPALVVGSFLVYGVNHWLYPESCPIEEWRETGLFLLATYLVSLMVLVGVFLIQRFYQQQQQRHTDQLLHQDEQIRFLHAQLNPHFFFNTLNNLYGISLHEPGRMPDLLMQLSKLMRYQVESSRRSWVSLQQEIEFITSYVTLEQERLGKRCQISYEYPTDNYELQTFQLAPLLLMPLVENAFKHGTGDIKGCFVHVALQLRNNRLRLSIENSLSCHKLNGTSTGLGLQNTRQRLDMLYPEKYQLALTQESDRYITLLEIQLATRADAQPVAVFTY
ncbi:MULTISPECIES: histidine kinase [unclassified Spirosoma]|uniref:sensor histidine kinase n=1 Tax=unclassified Spirosoma TaxID=2621999 RepID=UPI000968CF9E|nr:MULTISPECIES: histidine kinase [unclassified Spirosoma]MBN8822771.1 histidine kinase [Spirosoma sp.]OJW79981.1 MAG: histidine kinase [Spirosoma sp. 48-14]